MQLRSGSLWVFALAFGAFACKQPTAGRMPPNIVAPVALPPAETPLARAHWHEAREVFERRCVVCHGCYDAPCQLVLSSYEGIARGASHIEVYDPERLRAIEPTRLTVLRHFDSATVLKGFVGGPPKTAWVLGYATLERIHYLLVAGFDVFGNIGHQLDTRLYMDFLRMEAEHNFLALLPRQRRRALVDAWYKGVRGSVKDEVYGETARFDRETDITYHSQRPELELFGLLEAHLKRVLDRRAMLDEVSEPHLREPLNELALLGGDAASLMPETSFVEVVEEDRPARYFTILRDSAHTNVAHLFREDERRVPAEDQLTVLRGFVGAYPNALFRVPAAELAAFADAVGRLDGHAAYEALHARFGVRRTSREIWLLSDRMHAAYRKLAPIEAGLFDYNRLDGR